MKYIFKILRILWSAVRQPDKQYRFLNILKYKIFSTIGAWQYRVHNRMFPAWTVNATYLIFSMIFSSKSVFFEFDGNCIPNLISDNFTYASIQFIQDSFFCRWASLFIKLKSCSEYGLELSKHTLFTKKWQQLFGIKRSGKMLTVSLKWIKNIFLDIKKIHKSKLEKWKRFNTLTKFSCGWILTPFIIYNSATCSLHKKYLI